MKRILFLTLAVLLATTALFTACAEAPQPRTEAPTGQSLATDHLKLTILADDTVYDSRLKYAVGFSALVEYHGHTLLFDTGPNGSILLSNMQQLGIDPRSIETVVLSHQHADHTFGLQALLDLGIQPTVYLPSAFTDNFKDHVRAQTKLVEVTDALEILPGVHTTGMLGGLINKEQALIVETRDGVVIITGCAHPGIVQMIRRAQEIVPGKIALLGGGFHLQGKSEDEIQDIITELRQAGVQKVLPTHCTGDKVIAQFGAEYGENYVEGGVGRTVSIS